ncbi:MAG: hypothetical protein JRE12_00950 [Deltaproteobacteria bacterium]|nr:hypothetical protein [Deltaproteobacteria bacterium]
MKIAIPADGPILDARVHNKMGAMMLSWVTVWLVQMPVEVSVLGARFTLIRNIAAFLVAIPASILIIWLSRGAW